MKVLIASDHAGFDLKKFLIDNLPEIKCEDLGTFDDKSVDYPDYAAKLTSKIQKEPFSKNPENFGVLVCGSGQGMAIKANKLSHIRAALCWDLTSARLSREHNNANVLCMGGRMIPFSLAKEMLEVFLATPFAEGRHSGRVEKLC